jgi:hypothetical protein
VADHPAGQTVRYRLKPEVTPAPSSVDAIYKTVTWEFSNLAAPVLTQVQKDTLKAVATSTIATYNNSSWRLKTFGLPTGANFSNAVPALEPYQTAFAGMKKNPPEGAHCAV